MRDGRSMSGEADVKRAVIRSRSKRLVTGKNRFESVLQWARPRRGG
jgi:hypothetical protein